MDLAIHLVTDHAGEIISSQPAIAKPPTLKSRRYTWSSSYLLSTLFVVSKQLGSRYALEIVTIFGFSSLSAWNSGSVARHSSLIEPS